MKPEFTIKLELLWDSCKDQPGNKYKTCIHSGNAGDIIYSLPTVKMLGAEHFIINLCSDTAFGGLGGRSINIDTARSLCLLLLEQPYIKRVSIVQSNLPLETLEVDVEGIDFILDRFRLQDTFKHHLAICHAQAFGLHINLFEKWLYINSDVEQNDSVVIAFTPRYRSLPNEYWHEALSGLKNVTVLGLPTEFCIMAGVTANFVTCSNFFEMAKIIAGAKLFIGNPSLAYAIAEALKVPRIVEIPESPRNAYPIGRNGYIASDSITKTRNLIESLISTNPTETVQFQNVSLLKKTTSLEEQKQGLEEQKQDLEGQKQNLVEQLQNIQASSAWRLVCKYYKLRDKLLARGTKRRSLAKKFKKVFCVSDKEVK